jgi:peptidoglycan/LPS O-acetylase OafA/YrhL
MISLYSGLLGDLMNTLDFWSIALGFVAAAPIGLLAFWVVERRERRRIPKWHGWERTSPTR